MIFCKLIQNIIHWDKTQMIKKIASDKINKECTLFSFANSTHHSFTSDSQCLYELKHKVHFSKSVCGVFHLSLYFCSRSMGSLTLKCHNFFQNQNNRKATHSFAPRPQIYKLQQQVWEFNVICVSWSSWKTDLEKTF